MIKNLPTEPAVGPQMTDRTGREGQYQLENCRSWGIRLLRVKRSDAKTVG